MASGCNDGQLTSSADGLPRKTVRWPYGDMSPSPTISDDEDDGAPADPEDEEIPAAVGAPDLSKEETQEANESEESGDTPPLVINLDALQHIAEYYLPGVHGACIDMTELQSGSHHGVRVLHFADGWSCVGRFLRKATPLSVLESELATIDYLWKHTTMPVPQTYFVNPNPNHAVGAVFTLIERMEGVQLGSIWVDLTLAHKIEVIEQLADVIAQLTSLKFHLAGSLNAHGTLGPPLWPSNLTDVPCEAPFATAADFMISYLQGHGPESSMHFPGIVDDLHSFLDMEASNPIYHAPYRLIHNDFDDYNMLFLPPTAERGPKLSAIIDWDYAYTGPLYYLCGYPIIIQDIYWYTDRYADNQILRKRLVRCIANHFPQGSADREHVKRSFREKNQRMNDFKHKFMYCRWVPESMEASMTRAYVNRDKRSEWEAQTDQAYGGVMDWVPDSEDEGEGEDIGMANSVALD
ncbi:hypothetical protein B0A48_06693 [Cryoendolithus antarcticus]|uniref:Aminoglycoside phosphotransferase domain-containing protein n=1 Tax=Cryoendolithus antarcticus TaxID=1507870 RepID=A0A1V8T9H4_9PEZI|nr:hypothetical protein B0A48_06693 [Cryoendolithus antarcticus]